MFILKLINFPGKRYLESAFWIATYTYSFERSLNDDNKFCFTTKLIIMFIFGPLLNIQKSKK